MAPLAEGQHDIFTNALLRGIADALEMKPQTVFGVVNRLRDVGVDVPYRKAPLTPAQLSQRMRRRRQARRPLAASAGRG